MLKLYYYISDRNLQTSDYNYFECNRYDKWENIKYPCTIKLFIRLEIKDKSLLPEIFDFYKTTAFDVCWIGIDV